MRRTGLKKAWRAAQRLIYRMCSGTLILMYNRVAKLSNDPHLVAVSPQHFGEHLEVIRKCYIPLRLQRLVESLQERRIQKKTIVITFDDGYADNLHNASPLLEHHDIPATIFVTAGQAEKQQEFWWDELDRMLLQPG